MFFKVHYEIALLILSRTVHVETGSITIQKFILKYVREDMSSDYIVIYSFFEIEKTDVYLSVLLFIAHFIQQRKYIYFQ